MSVSSSRIKGPPDPAIVFALASESKSNATSHSSALKIGVDDPPGITAFSFFPFRMPPQTSSISRNSGKPIGISYTPRLLTWPETDIKRVPPFLDEPSPAYQAAPSRKTAGTCENVSQLFKIVGH